jgi:C-terminal processing protease CtpA/Prc
MVLNGSFEQLSKADDLVPAAWSLIGPREGVSVDKSVALSGSTSLKLVYAGGGYIGVSQSLAAAPYRGRLLQFSAKFKTSSAPGGSTGLWIRTNDAAGKVVGFQTTYSHPLDVANGWQERRAFIFVAPEAARLTFGVVLSGQGTINVDEATISVLENVEQKPLSSTAASFLDQSLALVRERALFASNVDWVAVRGRAVLIASGAKSTSDTYPAIEYALSSLGDFHSRFLNPNAERRLRSDGGVPPSEVTSAKFPRVAYVAVPQHVGSSRARATALADDIQKRIRLLNDASLCGWIVDLRRDFGGNMYPMIAGLSPLLGDGTLGYFVSGDVKTPWWVQGGAAGLGAPVDAASAAATSTEPFVIRDSSRVPVALLIGPGTASSGEMTLISFLGRGRVRTFGAPTSGQSTANEVIRLSDGSAIALTTALAADRTGHVYGGKIVPDEHIEGATAASAAEADAAVRAASEWLRSAAICAARAE